jgi:hypothetical protein
MFDVTDKRAVDRLAAVVVMLERREAEARTALDVVGTSIRGRTIHQMQNMTDSAFLAEQMMYQTASARWYEACAALAAARELTRDL